MNIWNRLFPHKYRVRARHASTEPYHAVTIDFSESFACAAVRSQEGRIYLSDDAPRIPLANCDCMKQCDCRYQHRRDRRTGPRRYSDIGFKALPFIYERRKQGDRRCA